MIFIICGISVSFRATETLKICNKKTLGLDELLVSQITSGLKNKDGKWKTDSDILVKFRTLPSANTNVWFDKSKANMQ